jgi:NADH-quinone oxidoreductase subunit M
MLQRVWLGPVNEKYKDMADVTSRELVTLVPLAIIVMVLGVYPHAVLDLINPTLLALNETVSSAAPAVARLVAP